MTNQIDNFIDLLKKIRSTGLTYKQMAEALQIKMNTLYTWLYKKNIDEKRAIYLTHQIKKIYPEQYNYVLTIMKEEEN